jgi:hypothetical protein
VRSKTLRTQCIGPTTYSSPDLWAKFSKTGSPSEEFSVFKSHSERFPDPIPVSGERPVSNKNQRKSSPQKVVDILTLPNTPYVDAVNSVMQAQEGVEGNSSWDSKVFDAMVEPMSIPQSRGVTTTGTNATALTTLTTPDVFRPFTPLVPATPDLVITTLRPISSHNHIEEKYSHIVTEDAPQLDSPSKMKLRSRSADILYSKLPGHSFTRKVQSIQCIGELKIKQPYISPQQSMVNLYLQFMILYL